MIHSGTPAFWRATLALCLGSFMIFANVYITQPLLPMLAEAFGVSALQSGWSFTITTLMLGVSLLLYGPLSDALGRKWIMLFSMAGATLCTALISQVDDYSMLLLLRALQGICLGGLPAVAIAYMGDEFSKRALSVAVGLYIAGNSLGGIGGRLIGGFVGDWLGWAAAFEVMAVVSLICLVVFYGLLPDSAHFKPSPLQPRKMAADMLTHLKNPLLLVAYLIGGFNFFIFINQYSYATFLLSDAPYNLSAGFLGMLFLTYLSGTLGSMLSGRICHFIPQPLVMVLGIMLLIAGSLVTLIADINAIIAGFLINALGFFIAHSCASSWVSQHAKHARASASSLYLLFYYLGASCGGFYLQPFWDAAGWQGVIAGSLLVLCFTAGLALWLYRQTQIALRPAQG
ncbi:MFS transporter [Marinobacterium jannaschii]|uniref:MFS transporter n=1 Tax=Marinobacterium jannaschii TaxID=64970 RepID=UPI000480446D|nr:MFS transporter [Marinobacterium jannaschii]